MPTICHTLEYVFQNTYEESRLNAVDVGDKDKWLKEGMDCNLLFWNGKVSVTPVSESNPTIFQLVLVLCCSLSNASSCSRLNHLPIGITVGH